MRKCTENVDIQMVLISCQLQFIVVEEILLSSLFLTLSPAHHIHKVLFIYFSQGKTWYTHGGTRWTAIGLNEKALAIYCWTPADACQLIQQHGQPHHPDWNTNIDDRGWSLSNVAHRLLHWQRAGGEEEEQPSPARHEGAANRRGRPETPGRHVMAIVINIPSASVSSSYATYSKYWGDPAEQLLSPESWSHLLGVMSRQWRVKATWLQIEWNESCPISVKGLLDALLLEEAQQHLRHLLMEREGGWRDVRVSHAIIEGTDLCGWTRRYTQQSVVRVMFSNLTCKDQDTAAAVRAIRNTSHGKWPLFHNEGITFG